MPMLIDHIDAIARKKKRTVLYVEFPPEPAGEDGWPMFPNWEDLPPRRQVIEWLDAHGIGWQPCAEFADANSMMSYMGQIYIDLPYDGDLPAYRELEAFLENPDGTARLPGIRFCYLPLDTAVKNAAHDEPGFWKRWAQEF